MNSKEALEEIKDWLEYKDADWATIKYVEKIEKDLEVLQILKDRLPPITILRVMEYEGTYVLYNSINSTSITKEEYELLKEWLENE